MSGEATSQAVLGPLPSGWEQITNSSGQTFWTNSITKIKSYYDPRKTNPHPDGFAPIPLHGYSLPEGWEILGQTVNNRNNVIYLDQNSHTSTSIDPRLRPLPDGWEAGGTSRGQTFWTNAERRIKTFYDPRKPNPHTDGFKPVPVEGKELPEGWEVVGKDVDVLVPPDNTKVLAKILHKLR